MVLLSFTIKTITVSIVPKGLPFQLYQKYYRFNCTKTITVSIVPLPYLSLRSPCTGPTDRVIRDSFLYPPHRRQNKGAACPLGSDGSGIDANIKHDKTVRSTRIDHKSHCPDSRLHEDDRFGNRSINTSKKIDVHFLIYHKKF